MDELTLQQERLAAARGDIPSELVFKNGRVVNVFNETLEEADLAVHQGLVVGLGRYDGREVVDLKGAYLAPGFIDGHLHVESSMLAPAELARVVAPRGTSALVADPHEIANVMGVEGILAMLAGSRGLPVEIFFMAPSCVPASPFEDSGAVLGANDLKPLLEERRVLGLAEVMNFPGAAAGDPDMLAKIAAFAGRPIDGHSPLLGGKGLNAYLTAGPESDHECTLLSEAAEKLARGMWVMIRQGTSAHNLDDLLPLVTPASERRCMLVSDDRHPDTLADEGHLDAMLAQAVAKGLDPLTAIRLVTLNPARRFGLARRGGLAPGWRADLVVLEDLERFGVRRVYQEGRLVAEGGRCLAPCRAALPPEARGRMNLPPLGEDAFRVRLGGPRARVIGLVPGQILTESLVMDAPGQDGYLAADPERDLARMVVVERHRASGNMGFGLLKGLGLTRGALASSVAHDSHNLSVVGLDDRSMLTAAHRVGEMGGGLAVALGDEVLGQLPLPLAGLMSDQPLEGVLASLEGLNRAAAQVCRTPEPWMPLSFLSLAVIPHLKLTDRGLVDVDAFQPVDLFMG